MRPPPTPEATMAKMRHLRELAMSEAPPMLALCLPDNTREVLDLTELADEARDALGVIRAALDLDFLPPEVAAPRPVWVVFMGEGWSTTGEGLEPPDLERGELQARHEIGMSGVGEALMAHMRHRDGSGWDCLQPFEPVPALDTIKWGEMSVSGRDGVLTMGGAIPDLLADIVGAERTPWPSMPADAEGAT